MVSGISDLDLMIIVGYFLIVLAIGILVGLKTKTEDDLFLGGRSLTWGVIGFSLFASNISSTTLIGLSGAAYSAGIAVSNYEWLSGLPLIIMAAIFIPVYLKARITTVPEFLELRYDVRSRKIFSLVTIIISVFVDMAGGLYAGAVVIKVFFPGIELWHTTLVLAVVAAVYTAFGGLKAVVYTDIIQALILIVGCSVLSYLLFSQHGFSWQSVSSSLPEGRLSVIRPLDDPMLPWLGTAVGVPLLGFWYWVTNQYVTQRVLAAKNINHARWGAILGGFLKILPLFIMVLPGAMAVSLIPDIANSDMVFPTLVKEVLPIGVVGIVLAGLISAIMSTVDSTLNSASTLIVMDWLKPHKPGLTSQQTARIGRITMVVIMAIAAVWAPLIGNFGGLWSYLQQIFAIIVPPVAVLFLLGMFYKRANGTAAFMTLIGGISLGIVFFLLRQNGTADIHFSVAVGIMFVVSSVLFIGSSFFGEPTDLKRVESLIYRPGLIDSHHEGSFLKDYRFQCLLLALSMGLVLIFFW